METHSPEFKSFKHVKQEVLESLPGTMEMATVRSALVTILKGMLPLAGDKVYGFELDRIERAIHYRLSLSLVDPSFCLTDEMKQDLMSNLKDLHKWQIKFTQRKEENANLFIVELHKVQTYKIL